jgi:hypothetical protein
LISLFHCSSSKNHSEISFEKTSPITIEKPYYQSWIAGIQGGGSGINLYLPVQNKELKLDSAYFRGMIAKVQSINLGYVSYFKTALNQNEDIIISSELDAEYGNQLPEKKYEFPFILKENECVISFREDNKIKYFKIENLFEMPSQQYPSASPKH